MALSFGGLVCRSDQLYDLLYVLLAGMSSFTDWMCRLSWSPSGSLSESNPKSVMVGIFLLAELSVGLVICRASLLKLLSEQ